MKFLDKCLTTIIVGFAVPFMFCFVNFIKVVEFCLSKNKKNFKSQILPFGLLMKPLFEHYKEIIRK